MEIVIGILAVILVGYYLLRYLDGDFSIEKSEVIDVGNIPKRLWHTVTKKELRANVLELAEEEKDIVYIRSFILDGEDIQNE